MLNEIGWEKVIINIPVDVEKIINKLEDQGFEAYAVGGCVRDLLLGMEPKDWDICTSALPQEIVCCFKDYRTIEVGIKHGTVAVISAGKSYEITAYRTEGEYKDNRRPEMVNFVSELKEDLARRDFTVNAMAYNSRWGLKDFYGGCSDLANKTLRCVGDKDKRFKEDALRILRAVRFASVLGFEAEKETNEAIHRNKALLGNISKERIKEELCKLLCGDEVKKTLIEYGDVMAEIIPEVATMIDFEQNNPHHSRNVWEHTLEALDNSENNLIVRLAVLLHDVAKPICYTMGIDGVGHFYGHGEQGAELAEEILKNLKFDNNVINNVRQLIKYHDAPLSPDGKFVKKWLNKIGQEELQYLISVKYADIMGQSEYKRAEKLSALNAVSVEMTSILEEKQCYSLKDLAVNGRDLAELGMCEGRQMGDSLNFLLDKVIDGEIENDKKTLIKELKSNDKLQHNFY